MILYDLKESLAPKKWTQKIFHKMYVASLDQWPGRIKCFCAPSHQILAKSAPQNARNRDKAEFATKVRKSSINCVNVIILSTLE